jgi:mannose-6-phosphate isomerase-like protein (cupin superfamily)
MTGHRIAFAELEWTSPFPGVRHKVQNVGARVLRFVEYSSAMKPHWCDRGHLGDILEGRFEIEFAEGTWVFDAGDGVAIPSGARSRHRARVLTDVVRAVFVEDA